MTRSNEELNSSVFNTENEYETNFDELNDADIVKNLDFDMNWHLFFKNGVMC